MVVPARGSRLALVLIAGASLAACGTVTPRYPSHAGASPPPQAAGQGRYKVGDPYQVAGVWYVPHEQPDYDQTGVASWYGDEFNQKATANGEIFDMNAVSAAHTTLPLPSLVEVTNLDNGKRLVVRVNDRGPFVGNRIIDLSHEAARQLGYDRAGLAHVRVRYVGPAPLLGPDAGVRYADARPLATRMPRPIPAATSAAAPVAPAVAHAASTTGADPVMELAAGAPQKAAPLAAAPLADAVPRAIAAPAVVSSSDLPPLTGAAIAATPIPPAPGSATPVAVAAASPPVAASVASPSIRAAMAVSSPLRIQAGAFSNEANAQRAVSQLAPAGQASIEPVERNGATLYRVVMPAPADEAEAYALRDRVAQIGFADARVIQSF